MPEPSREQRVQRDGMARIKHAACDLLCEIAETNKQGETVGYPYDYIVCRIRKRCPDSKTSTRSLASYVKYISQEHPLYADWHGKLPTQRPRSGQRGSFAIQRDPIGGCSLNAAESRMSRRALNTILNGPPGTGKTFDVVSDAVRIVDENPPRNRADTKVRFDELRKQKQIEFVTFHQNYAYEDFIEGIRPVLDDDEGELRYELHDGIFKQIAKRASEDSDNRYVLIIDEINRGNIAKVFGELITLIEPSKRAGEEDAAQVMLPYSQEPFSVPANLYLIGTMNTADRGIALLDVALRRRFDFVERMPNPDHEGIEKDIEGVDGRSLLLAINGRIVEKQDREHQIGHTYLIGVKTIEALKRAFQNRVVPLLQEYFYDDWEKLRGVLNDNAFITRREGAERAVFDVLPSDDDRWLDAKEYQKIYSSNSGATDGE